MCSASSSGDHVQAHEVGGTGGLARTGYHSQDVSGFQQAATDKILLGHRHHLFGGARLAAAHGMDPPVEVHALHHGLDVGEGVDGGLGRYFEIMRAVLPVSVKTAMAPMGKSSAE